MATEIKMPQLGLTMEEGTVAVSYTHLTLPTKQAV